MPVRFTPTRCPVFGSVCVCVSLFACLLVCLFACLLVCLLVATCVCGCVACDRVWPIDELEAGTGCVVACVGLTRSTVCVSCVFFRTGAFCGRGSLAARWSWTSWLRRVFTLLVCDTRWHRTRVPFRVASCECATESGNMDAVALTVYCRWCCATALQEPWTLACGHGQSCTTCISMVRWCAV